MCWHSRGQHFPTLTSPPPPGPTRHQYNSCPYSDTPYPHTRLSLSLSLSLWWSFFISLINKAWNRSVEWDDVLLTQWAMHSVSSGWSYEGKITIRKERSGCTVLTCVFTMVWMITHWTRDRQPLPSPKEPRAHRDGSMGRYGCVCVCVCVCTHLIILSSGVPPSVYVRQPWHPTQGRPTLCATPITRVTCPKVLEDSSSCPQDF